MICITIYVEEVGVLLIFVDFCIWWGLSWVFKCSFLSSWWVHVDGKWDISCHVWDQGKRVILVNSFSHWGAWRDIEDNSEFGQWFAWFHQPSDLGILHVFLNFFSSYPMIGVATNSVFPNEVSIGNGDLWNLTSSFVFVPQYSWMIFFTMWYVC